MNIFITGGSSGIGLSLAKLYLEEGHRVGICARDLKKFPDEIKNKYKLLKCYEVDVLDSKALKDAVHEFAGEELDIIFANAGRSVGSKSVIPQFSVAKEVIDINVNGVLNTFEAAFDLMFAKKKGHIVVMASVAGFVGLPGAGPYSASKAAVLKLCESYSIDFKKFGIHITAIAPGFIDTPLTRKNNHKMPFLMDSKKAAILIKKAVSDKKELFIFPLSMKIVVMLLDKMPRVLYRNLMKLRIFNYSSGK